MNPFLYNEYIIINFFKKKGESGRRDNNGEDEPNQSVIICVYIHVTTKSSV
jgi:hypothetical protein